MTAASYKLALYRRKAAKLGMTLDQFMAFCEREHERICRIAELRSDRDLQFAVLSRRAMAHGRTLTRFA